MSDFQLAWVPTRLHFLLLPILCREYELKTGGKKGETENRSRRKLNTATQGTYFGIMLVEIPEHIVCFVPLSTLAKAQRFKPFKTSSLHSLIDLLVWKKRQVLHPLLVARSELQYL